MGTHIFMGNIRAQSFMNDIFVVVAPPGSRLAPKTKPVPQERWQTEERLDIAEGGHAAGSVRVA